jgi:RNA 2',3'-cyclic 3'-phosphodiesterase
MKRIFVAIKVDPGETLINWISSMHSALSKESIKWTESENLHITLAFLGDTEESVIKKLSAALEKRCQGYGNFDLIIKGAGVFKSLNDPRVIWTGVHSSEKLAGLNMLVRHCLEDSGIESENRPFRPHLTLGRIRSLNPHNGLESLIQKNKGIELQNTAVSEIILFESILLKTGAVYNPLDKFVL